MSKVTYARWNEMSETERIAAVTELIGEGCSDATVAKRLRALGNNGHASANVIIGFRHRRGLRKRDNALKRTRISTDFKRRVMASKRETKKNFHKPSQIEEEARKRAEEGKRLITMVEKKQAHEMRPVESKGTGFCPTWKFDRDLGAEAYCGRPTNGAAQCEHCRRTDADVRMKIAG